MIKLNILAVYREGGRRFIRRNRILNLEGVAYGLIESSPSLPSDLVFDSMLLGKANISVCETIELDCSMDDDCISGYTLSCEPDGHFSKQIILLDF